MPSKKNSASKGNNDMTVKIVIIVAFVVAFFGGYLIARAKYKPQLVQLSQMVLDKDAALQKVVAKYNNITMKDGKMWIVENGVLKQMDNAVVLQNGDKISTDGKVTKTDGSSMMMKNGESIDMQGNLMQDNSATNSGGGSMMGY